MIANELKEGDIIYNIWTYGDGNYHYAIYKVNFINENYDPLRVYIYAYILVSDWFDTSIQRFILSKNDNLNKLVLNSTTTFDDYYTTDESLFTSFLQKCEDEKDIKGRTQPDENLVCTQIV